MHPKMMIALAHAAETDRQRERNQIERSFAPRQGRMGATNSTTRMAGREFVRRLLVFRGC